MRRTALTGFLAALLPILTGCAEVRSYLGDTPSKTAASPAPRIETHADDTPVANPNPDKQTREFYLRIVQALEDQGKNYAALAYLKEYEGKFSVDADAGLLRGKALLAVGRLSEAEGEYERLLTTDLRAAGYEGLGEVQASREAWDAAKPQFRMAAELRPTNTKFLNNYGFALLKSGDLQNAEFTLRQAADLAPDNDAIRNNLLLCLHLEHNDAEVARMMGEVKSPDMRDSLELKLAQWMKPETRSAAPVEKPPHDERGTR